ncbi:HipA N-terminal domain-containing protein [Vibrio sp. TMPB1044]|uniref:HipA N-terminal domain-containing protein n=1 Tax=Vibrio sp. TMPB1044 TaxID=3051822 RepID=UPI0033428EB4
MQKLITYMNGELVDALEKHQNGAHTFQYDKNWITNAVINYFDNLLPDSPQVRDRIVARYNASSKQPFDILKEIGKYSVGAIALLPPELPYIK